MKNYESPVIFDNEELAEGVYATGSGGGLGSDCYTQKVECSQQPHLGQEYFVFHVDCYHNATDGHHSEEHTLTLDFDRAVYCSHAEGNSGIRNFGSRVEIDYLGNRWHNNAHETIGLSDIRIDGNPGDIEPKVTNSIFTCNHACSCGATW